VLPGLHREAAAPVHRPLGRVKTGGRIEGPLATTLVNPPSLARPSGVSHGVEGTGGRLLFLARQTAPDAAGRSVAPGRPGGQFRRALASVGAVIEARGGTLRDLVKVTFYVRDKADYRAKVKPIGQIYRDMLGGHYPATTLVEVTGLWDDDALVEIDGIAVMEER